MVGPTHLGSNLAATKAGCSLKDAPIALCLVCWTQTALRLDCCWASMTASMMDGQTHSGSHLAVTSASPRQKDAPKAARLAYSTPKASWKAVCLAGTTAEMLASQTRMDVLMAYHWEQH